MSSIDRVVITVLIGLAASITLPTKSGAVSGKEVLETCAEFPGGGSPNRCRLYVQSMIGFVNSDDSSVNPKGKLCVGEEVDLKEVVKLINSWLLTHPALHASNGYDATYGAFAQKYRCK